MPELSTPRLRFSQEKTPANNTELRSTAGEMMSDRKRVLEEVKVMTRDAMEVIDKRKVMASLAMFLEHQGTGLPAEEERKYSSRGERRRRKVRGRLERTSWWKQGVKSGSEVYQVMAESQRGPPHTSIISVQFSREN